MDKSFDTKIQFTFRIAPCGLEKKAGGWMVEGVSNFAAARTLVPFRSAAVLSQNMIIGRKDVGVVSSIGGGGGDFSDVMGFEHRTIPISNYSDLKNTNWISQMNKIDQKSVSRFDKNFKERIVD